ncbi:hypothetical protein F2P56_000323 [Juglans regia]|uniref:Prolyl 4-hydroxylase 7 n=1 Tax=Juglans regia TaxID=51240 RepID=A0A834D9K4_JUGRE|nr:hypothetical protein F2P56_000323 [Juglans regia]
MDCRSLIPLSICFIFLLPSLSLSAIQLRGLLGDKNAPESVLRLNGGAFSPAFDPTRVTQLSWRPRAFVYKGFLTDGECDHLIKLSRDKLEKSMVADNESGKSITSEVRTSSGMFLQKAQVLFIPHLPPHLWTSSETAFNSVHVELYEFIALAYFV